MLNRINKFDRKNGPLQIVHDFKFVALNVKDDYSELNNMIYDDKKAAIFARLDKLFDNGYGGVVLNVDYNNYLQDVDSFKLLEEIIDYADNIGLKVWIYDEQYYPSGSAGGLTLKNHPELEGICLACVSDDFTVEEAPIRISSPLGYSELKFAVAVKIKDGIPDFSKRIDISQYKDLAGGLCWDAPDGEWRVYAFFCKVMYELTYLPQSLRASRRYPNLIDKRAFERFVDVTYKQGYEKHIKNDTLSKVEAVFTDEPSMYLYHKFRGEKQKTTFYSVSIYDKPNANIEVYPYISWMIGLEKIFYDKFGYDFIISLPDMFDDTENSKRVRTDFYTLITELTEDAFIMTNKEYLNSKGIKLSGHYYGEESFDKHPFLYGDLLNHLGGMDIPGCDRLNSDASMLRYSAALKMASSAAHINGKDKVMIEASNMFDKDQNITLDRMICAMNIIFSQGINVITSYYGENILPKNDLKKFTEYTAKVASVLEGGRVQTDTLLFYPYKEICAKMIPESAVTECFSDVIDSIDMANSIEYLISRQISFDIINMEKLKKCKIEKGHIITDYGQVINRFVLPNISFVNEETSIYLNKLVHNNISVEFFGEIRKIEGLDFVPKFIDCNCKKSSKLNEFDPYINVMHKIYDEGEILFIANTIDVDKEIIINIDSKKKSALIFNPYNNAVEDVNFQPDNKSVKIMIEAYRAKMLLLF